MIVMILDATKRAEQRALLEAELDAVGIRLNQDPPNIYLKPKTAGGVKITFQATPKHLDQKMLYNILKDYRILNCEVLIRDEDGMYNFLLGTFGVAIRPHRVVRDLLTTPQRPSTSSSTSS
jgi:ribosome-interacting GTPase 1